MTKTEEALCNGILFSVPRLVPTAVQEGELDNAMYYVVVYLSAQQDKAVMKLYEAPSYTPLKWNDEEIDCIVVDLFRKTDSDNENSIVGYNYGDKDGDVKVLPSSQWIKVNKSEVLDGLMLYPGLKCIIVNSIKAIIRNKNREANE